MSEQEKRVEVERTNESETPSDNRPLSGAGCSDQPWRVQGDPRWKIGKWPDGHTFIEGPIIEAADESLTGLDWGRAATIEVIPTSALSALIEKWEKRAESWREIRHKGTNPEAKGRAGELGTCARDLRQLLDPTPSTDKEITDG